MDFLLLFCINIIYTEIHYFLKIAGMVLGVRVETRFQQDFIGHCDMYIVI